MCEVFLLIQVSKWKDISNNNLFRSSPAEFIKHAKSPIKKFCLLRKKIIFNLQKGAINTSSIYNIIFRNFVMFKIKTDGEASPITDYFCSI